MVVSITVLLMLSIATAEIFKKCVEKILWGKQNRQEGHLTRSRSSTKPRQELFYHQNSECCKKQSSTLFFPLTFSHSVPLQIYGLGRERI